MRLRLLLRHPDLVLGLEEAEDKLHQAMNNQYMLIRKYHLRDKYLLEEFQELFLQTMPSQEMVDLHSMETNEGNRLQAFQMTQ